MPFDSTLSPCSQAFWQIAVAFAALSPAHLAFGQTAKPAELTCNSPITPLGIDVNPPKLSWQLRDERQGARQTAYEVQVASSPSLLEGGKHDVWDSGQVESAQSVDVIYAGIALAPEKRYYWRVLTWDQEEKPYPESDISWWETGWAAPSQWRGQWIGYEKPEHRRMREADAAWITNPGVDDYMGSGDTHHRLSLRHYPVLVDDRRRHRAMERLDPAKCQGPNARRAGQGGCLQRRWRAPRAQFEGPHDRHAERHGELRVPRRILFPGGSPGAAVTVLTVIVGFKTMPGLD
jgi:hypothetical protein